MNPRLLVKTGFYAICAILALLLTSASVAEDSHAARTIAHPESAILEDSTSFHPVARKTPTTSKKRRSAAPTLLASTTGVPAPSTLVAAVNKPGVREAHRQIASNVLNAIPSGCKTNLKNFSVLYADATHRGLGGKTTIILDGSVSDTEFAALLIHECGHVIHANMLGDLTSGKSAFKDGADVFAKDSPVVSFFTISWTTERVTRAGVRKTDFVSGYASSDAFEDFAETFAAYILHRPSLRERAKTNAVIAAKLAWMEANLPASEAFSNSLYTWNGTVPRDVTKLAYVMK